MPYTEIIGIVASVLIVLAMLFKTDTTKQAICLRAVNAVGASIFVVYGFLVPAYATAIANFCIVLISLYHIILLSKKRKQEKAEEHMEEQNQKVAKKTR